MCMATWTLIGPQLGETYRNEGLLQVSFTPEQPYFPNKNEMEYIAKLQIITTLMIAHGPIQTQTPTRLIT